MINLPIPYKSQWAADAVKSKSDCYAASLAMVAAAFGKNYSTDQLTVISGAGTGMTSMIQAIDAIQAIGLIATRTRGSTISDLKSFLDVGRPVIALLHYGALSDRQDQNFKGGHFLVARGYDDSAIITNDPDYYGARINDGEAKRYPIWEFEKAMNSNSADGNTNGTLLVFDGLNFQTPPPPELPIIADQSFPDTSKSYLNTTLNQMFIPQPLFRYLVSKATVWDQYGDGSVQTITSDESGSKLDQNGFIGVTKPKYEELVAKATKYDQLRAERTK
jgi:hypothetical protein